MKYYRLLDHEHKGTIVRAEGRVYEEHVPQKGWVRSGILIHYFWPDSDTYGMCEEISETEALSSI